MRKTTLLWEAFYARNLTIILKLRTVGGCESFSSLKPEFFRVLLQWKPSNPLQPCFLQLVEDTIWLGANDFESDNNFVWQSGQPVYYSNWYPGRPDNADGINEQCLELFSNGHWNDYSCDLLLPVFCEFVFECWNLRDCRSHIEREWHACQAALMTGHMSKNLLWWCRTVLKNQRNDCPHSKLYIFYCSHFEQYIKSTFGLIINISMVLTK